MKKKLAALLMAMCMAVPLAACGNSADQDKSGSGTSSEGGGGAADSSAGGQDQDTGGSDNSGKTDLAIALDVDIDTLHPSDFSTTAELNVLNQIYDTLIFMNPDGEHDPEPRLAETYEASDDGMDYTFHLNEDATFHDGTPVTAEDVVFSLNMYKDSQYQNTQVEGLKEAEAADEHTVVCHLERPYAPFLLGVSVCHIASKSYYESSGDDFVNKPVGSGPYKYVDRSKGSSITLEAYDGYYRGEASIKDLTFEVIPDQSTMAVALQTGEIQFAEIEASNTTQLQAADNVKIDEVANSGFTYLCMNLENELFQDVKVRQAVNYALNRENIVEICYEGTATVNSNLCSTERFGYSKDQPQYTYDPEKAKSLLAEAGIETPYDLGEILVAEQYSDLATVLQSNLKEAGLETTIAVKEFNAYIDDLTGGNFTLSALNMTLDGDTQMMEMAFGSDYIGTSNNARYSDKEMDDLFDQTREETDRDKRAQLFDQIFTKAQEEAVYAPICNPLTLFAYNTGLACGEIPFEGAYHVYDFAWQ